MPTRSCLNIAGPGESSLISNAIRSKSGDARKRPNANNNTKTKNAIPTGFRPINPAAEHGYRIDVARDGSMITAVPIEDEQSLRGGGGSKFKSPQRPPRASPILFSQQRSSPNGSTTWSTQGLLDARGKQRHKMKRRDKLKHAKGFLAFTGTNHKYHNHKPYNQTW